MGNSFYSTKEEILYELNTLVRELHEIAGELRSSQGIGAELCTSKLNHIAERCERTKGQLHRI